MGDELHLSLPFVSCSVCYDTGKTNELFLTSCAHILCKEHASLQRGLNNLSCLACNHGNISIVKLDKNVPHDIRPFLTPFPTQIEQFFAVAQFQYVGMMERIQYQDSMIMKLIQKVSKQKELLLLAKEKVSEIDTLESRIFQLQQENRELKADLVTTKYACQTKRPVTIDLTTNDSSDSTDSSIEPSSRLTVSDAFLRQVKQSSSQKSAVSKPYISPYSNSALTMVHKNQSPISANTSLELSKSKIAESTKIIGHGHSPMQSNVPLGNKLHPVMMNFSSSGAPSLSSGSKPLSTASSDTSLKSNFTAPHVQGKNRPKVVPLHQQDTHMLLQSAPNYSLSGRVNKQRASTSHIAQRLSAHMKIGSLQKANTSTVQDGTSGALLRKDFNSSSSNSKFTK